MRKEIACLVVVCEMVVNCRGFFNDKDEKFVASLDLVYIQNVPDRTEDQVLSPDLFVRRGSPDTYVLYDAFVTVNGYEGGVEILRFQIVDVSMLVDNRIVLITDVPGTILHCQFSTFSSSFSAQKFYSTILITSPLISSSIHSFSLVKVSKINDDGSLLKVSGDKVTMRVHSLKEVDDVTMLRFVIELNGRDEAPFLVFTSTNAGVSDINRETNEMALEIWDGLFTKHRVLGFIVKFNAREAYIFTSMFGQKFDEILSALSRRYITKMGPSSSRGPPEN